MSVYLRGGYYWFKFKWNGKTIYRSRKQAKKRAAEEIESAFRTALAKGEVVILTKRRTTLREFSRTFLEFVGVRSAEKPQTVKFYTHRVSRLLLYKPLADAQLADIDEALIE